MRLITFAVALGMGVSAVSIGSGAQEPSGARWDGNAGEIANYDFALTVADPASERSDNPRASKEQLAQFQVPKTPEKEGAPAKPALPGTLPYQYSWGTEMEFDYKENLDLDSRLKDTALIFKPSLFGTFTYRPTDWLETFVEATLEKEVALIEQDPLTLPDGSMEPAPSRRASLFVDQLYARFKPVSVPAQFTVGRRSFEDPRRWLYDTGGNDTAMDAAILTLKLGDFNVESSVSRENFADMDVFRHVPVSKINNYIVYAEYRGFEDHTLAGYWILRDDRSGREGKPQFMGLRALARPTDAFSYWADLGYLAGKDENTRHFNAAAFDVGGIYRFLNLPLQPCVVLGFAYATGDSTPDTGKNTEYRQTGLQSNEGRFCGVTQFINYGEALDPELSNLKLLTFGVGFRPTANTFVDLVYHRYWLNEIASEIRGQALTAEMNQFGSSRNVGDELDVIVGFRNLFGVRGLGFETKAGIFFPGDAWRRSDGSKPDLGVSVVGLFIF